jgi:hypothetical protein
MIQRELFADEPDGTTDERWKLIPGFSLYEFSDRKQVRSYARRVMHFHNRDLPYIERIRKAPPRPVKLRLTKWGWAARLNDDGGVRRWRFVDKLAFELFGIPYDTPQTVANRKKPDREALAKLYEVDRLSTETIGARLGVGGSTVKSWLRSYGIRSRKNGEALRAPGRPSDIELRRLYSEEKLTTRQIGKMCGVRHITIRRWLAEIDCDVRPAGRGLVSRGIDPPNRDELHRMIHINHLTYKEIGSRFGVDLTAVTYWVKKHGVEPPTIWYTRRKGRMPRLPDAAELASLYESGLSLDQIGERFGVCSGPIKRLCLEYGIEIRPPGFMGKAFTCRDGHVVKSGYEAIVDDWLSAHGIAHEYEPRLPFGTYLADFLANGWYIEVWGLVSRPSYVAQMTIKQGEYRRLGLPLIQVKPHNFTRVRGKLSRSLDAKLRACLSPPIPLTSPS